MLAPAFKAYVSRRKSSDGRPLPGEVTLGPVSAENHGRASVTVPIAPGLVLSCIPYIKYANGPDEIEFRPADIDVCAILNEPEGPVGGNKVTGIWSAPRNFNWVSGVAPWKGLSRSSAVVLEERIKDAVCIV